MTAACCAVAGSSTHSATSHHSATSSPLISASSFLLSPAPARCSPFNSNDVLIFFSLSFIVLGAILLVDELEKGQNPVRGIISVALGLMAMLTFIENRLGRQFCIEACCGAEVY